MVLRSELKSMKRILIKVGTSSLTRDDGSIALGPIGDVCEQIADLVKKGHRVVLVSSGSKWIGQRKIRQQELLTRPLQSHVDPTLHGTDAFKINSRAYAACGQNTLMSLYDLLFQQKGIMCSQILLTGTDFENEERRNNVRETINYMLDLDIVPIVNENDTTSITSGKNLTDNHRNVATKGNEITCRRRKNSGEWKNPTPESIFSNNDTLASIVATEIGMDLMLLVTDVKGLYKVPPSKQTKNVPPEIIKTYCLEKEKASKYDVGESGSQGTGGMSVKLDSALYAVSRGVKAVVICSSKQERSIVRVVEGEDIGTLFVAKSEDLESSDDEVRQPKQMAISSREQSRKLQLLSTQQRTSILNRISDDLMKKKDIIMEENEIDLRNAERSHLHHQLKKRLKLTTEKIETLSKGIKQIAQMNEPIGKVIKKTQVSEDVVLEQVTVPIGVCLIIFESRPDVLPQIAALAIKSGNGLILKGGSEAKFSNRILHEIIGHAIEVETKGNVESSLIGLVENRKKIDELLKLDKYIDLCIPRGSGNLVSYIQSNTQICVLGHAEGICHAYVHPEADFEKAKRIIIDAKTDYPAACNAIETLLIDKNFKKGKELLKILKEYGITLFAHGETFKQYGDIIENETEEEDYKMEYSDLCLTVKMVDSGEDAINHINRYGSSHTDIIVTENKNVAEHFLRAVDSACVFHNVSSRFADGYRMGLGAEVGISTHRIHARGPVGIEGLLSQKWIMRTKSSDTAKDYSTGAKEFIHKALM